MIHVGGAYHLKEMTNVMNGKMKFKVVLISVILVILLNASGVFSASVVGSKHDLTSTTGASAYKTTGTNQVCVFCHTPHFSSAAAPLWNRTASAASYQMYNSSVSATMDMTVAANPQGVSAVCLSCHDGTVAFDSLLNKPGSGSGAPSGWSWNAAGNTMISAMSPSTMLGSDLRNDHPISVTYDASRDPAFVAPVNGTVNGLPLYGAGKNQVECASCHNVHDNANAPFLRVSNGGSALCLKCHIK
jgi:predicted CXXCH cytochrome family protein